MSLLNQVSSASVCLLAAGLLLAGGQAPSLNADARTDGRVTLELRRPGSDEPVQDLDVCSPFRLILRVEALGRFPEKGEVLRVVLPHYLMFRMASLPQGSVPDAAGYTCVTTGPPGIELRFLHPEIRPPMAATLARRFDVLFGRPLEPGERLEVVYGAGEGGAALAQEQAVSPGVPGYKPFECVRLAPSGEPLETLASVRPEIRPGPASRLEVIAPASVRPGEPFDVRVLALDRWGNPAPLDGTSVELSADGTLSPPGPVRLDGAVGVAGGAVAREEGVYRLSARCGGERPLSGRSNPVLARTTGARIYFGDFHVHSGEASQDSYGSMEDVYRYARDIAGLDFVAKTDHDVDLTAAGWKRTLELAEFYDDPGRFAAFCGFEWTPPFSHGHRTVLFPGLRGEVVAWDRPPAEEPAGLWSVVARHGGLALPHCPSAEPLEHHHYDWSRHSPRLEPAVEIFSQWVKNNRKIMARDTETNPAGVQYALARGIRLGIYASSDNHTGMAGRTGGLAGVFADRLDRESLLAAVRARRTFGTSGQRILVDFGAPDAVSGEVSPSASGPVRLRATVHGTAPLERLEIVKGWPGSRVPFAAAATFRPAAGTEDVELEWEDPAATGEVFYYLRVHQVDGGIAWSSPVWFVRPGPPPSPAAPPEQNWEELPIQLGWEAGTLVVPSENEATLSEIQRGYELSTRITDYVPPSDDLFQGYFWVRSQPFELPPGPHRLSFALSSRWPMIVAVMVMDERRVNAGFFELVPVLGTMRVSREFVCRPHSGRLRLVFYHAAMPGRYRVEDLRLHAGREPAE